MVEKVPVGSCWLFEGLAPAVLERIESITVRERFPSGESIFAEGDPANDLFILGEGEVELSYVLQGRSPVTLRIAHIRPGDVFGWSALARNEKLTADAQTNADSVVWRIPVGPVLEIMDADPAVGYLVMTRLVQLVARRLRDTRSEMRWFQSAM